MIRSIRRICYITHYLALLGKAVLKKDGGIWQRQGRLLIAGKVRRALICLVPGLPEALQKKYGMTGGCRSCGVSCNLLIRCPHWDFETRLCSIYEDRPLTCRTFPITPADLKEVALANAPLGCGYNFEI